MKILIICHEFPPLGGGAANGAYYLAKDFTAKNHEVTVLTSKSRRLNSNDQNFNIVYLPVLRRYIDRTSPLELLSFAILGILYGLFNVRKKKFDACIAIHGIPSGWVALFLYWLFKIPYVVSLRGGDVPGFLPQSYNKLHKKVNLLTDLYWANACSIITNSHGLKEIADITANRIKKEIKVIPNGVNCQVFEPDLSLRDNHSIKIIYTGRITLQKGLECFIEALRKSRKEIIRRFSVEIIGDGPLKEYLRGISVDLQAEGILTFTDWLDKQNLLIKYKKAHIFILPSLYEGMSNSLLEAMACGCMVIATNISGNNEVIREGDNGFLFAPGDIRGLSNILVRVLNSDIKTIELMGNRSRIIAQTYDWDIVTDSYIRYIKNILPR